jgi:mono/diheme cytochrome c family protein
MSENSKTIATSFALLALAAVRDRLAQHEGSVLDGGSVAPEAPLPVEVWNPAASSVLERGRRLFQDAKAVKCTECHQDDGSANGPSLVGVADRYLDAKRTHDKAADYLRHHIRTPKQFPGLNAAKYTAVQMFEYGPGILSDDQVNDIVEFLLSRFGGLPVAKCGPLEAGK